MSPPFDFLTFLYSHIPQPDENEPPIAPITAEAGKLADQLTLIIIIIMTCTDKISFS
jgi:hypothetical protein